MCNEASAGAGSASIDTLLCDEANLANGWLTLQKAMGSGACRKCQVVVQHVRGPISNAQITYTPFLITSKAGRAMWSVTGLCEPCAAGVLAGHEVAVAQTPARRMALVYRESSNHKWVWVRQPNGKMPDLSPLDENIMILSL
jgi:hypothetical protein